MIQPTPSPRNLTPAQLEVQRRRDAAKAHFAQRGMVSRLADPSLQADYSGLRKRRHRRKYAVFEIKAALDAVRQHGLRRAARMLNISAGTLHSWRYRSKLPKTGKNSLPNMKRLVDAAKRIWLAKERNAEGQPVNEVEALFRAVRKLGVNINSMRVFHSMGALPAPPGFRIYTDSSAQMRAEAIYRGEKEAGELYEWTKK